MTVTHSWDLTPAEAVALQRELREQLVLRPPPRFRPRHVAGADLSCTRGDPCGHAAIVVLDAVSLEPVDEAAVVAPLRMPYIPGLLSFRELPPLLEAWDRLSVKPDVLIFDGHGSAHPRRFGLACHGGLALGVPTIGCAKSLLVGEHGRLGRRRGATADLVHKGEVIGKALRTRTGVRPVYVSAGHLMDVETAAALVLRATAGFREPETTRFAHRLTGQLRRGAAAAGSPGRR